MHDNIVAMKRRVILYETHAGVVPVERFLRSLTAKEQQKLVWGLKILEDGFPLKEPYFKKIQTHEGLWELRVTFGGNAYRVYFFELTGNLIVALCGAQKKNDKDQKKEIMTAAQYMQEAKERAHEDT